MVHEINMRCIYVCWVSPHSSTLCSAPWVTTCNVKHVPDGEWWRGGVRKKIQLHNKLNWISNDQQMWFKSNLIFWFELPVWTWILTALRLKFPSNHRRGYSLLYELSFWITLTLQFPFPSSLLSLSSPSPFYSPLLQPTLSVSFFCSVLHILLFSSTPALSNSFYPHSKFYLCPLMSIHPSLLFCPCQTLSSPSTFSCSSMVHLLHPCPQGNCPWAVLLLQCPQRLSQLTQQDDNAQQDCNQSSRAETRRWEECLALAHPDPAMALAWTHPQGQGAGPTQRRLPTVPHYYGQLIQLLGQVVETPPPCNDAGCAVYNKEKKIIRKN